MFFDGFQHVSIALSLSKAPYFSGDNVTYFWEFGDNTGTFNTTKRHIIHVYQSKGEYNVSVRAQNLISSKENTTSIIIQDEVKDITLTTAPLIATVGVTHTIDLTINGKCLTGEVIP